MSDTQDLTGIATSLAAPFTADEVEWKPQTVKGNRALAIAYIDARCVMERLDAVVGVGGWQDRYEVLPDGNAVCTLSLRINGEWLAKVDVGGESDQKDDGDRRKAAFSDALKRAAVKWGIGRYLYSLPSQWCDYDPAKHAFVATPRLPDWANPDKQAAVRQTKAASPAPAEPKKELPASGTELVRRTLALDKELSAAGVIEDGQLSDGLDRWAIQKNLPLADQWTAQHIKDATAWVAQFVKAARASAKQGAPA